MNFTKLIPDYKEFVAEHPSFYPALARAAAMVRPERYLEIGVRDGGSLVTVLTSCNTVVYLTLCDDWGTANAGTGRGSHAHIDTLLTKFGYRGFVQYLDGNSQETVPKYIVAGSFYDLVLVDGSHAEQDAAMDLRNAWPLLRQGGILLFDDITLKETSYLKRVFKDFMCHQSAEIWEELDEKNGVALARKK